MDELRYVLLYEIKFHTNLYSVIKFWCIMTYNKKLCVGLHGLL